MLRVDNHLVLERGYVIVISRAYPYCFTGRFHHVYRSLFVYGCFTDILYNKAHRGFIFWMQKSPTYYVCTQNGVLEISKGRHFNLKYEPETISMVGICIKNEVLLYRMSIQTSKSQWIEMLSKNIISNLDWQK